MIYRHQCIAASTKIKSINSNEILHLLYISDTCISEENLLQEGVCCAVLSWRLSPIYCLGLQDIRMCLKKDISWNSHLPEKKPAEGLFRYPFNSSHYSIFCSEYWNVPNNMLFEGKLAGRWVLKACIRVHISTYIKQCAFFCRFFITTARRNAVYDANLTTPYILIAGIHTLGLNYIWMWALDTNQWPLMLNHSSWFW